MKEVKSLGRFGNVHVKMGWMMNGGLLLRERAKFYLTQQFCPLLEIFYFHVWFGEIWQ
jgi:hypothetical protein